MPPVPEQISQPMLLSAAMLERYRREHSRYLAQADEQQAFDSLGTTNSALFLVRFSGVPIVPTPNAVEVVPAPAAVQAVI